MTRIDVYPVGALANIHSAWRYLTLPARRFPTAARHPAVTWRWRIDRAYSPIYGTYRSVRRYIRFRQWRALRNHFNGYLAEPVEFPPGLTNCGRGWTRRAALRSLQRAADRAGVPWNPPRSAIDDALRRSRS